ncbi:MAG TPA: 4-hydroxy-tetrahydrodipicolinate reductase, partial [Ruminococcaceae bacterium]|nr:4-hydroxy-tetrahydrodipicolinate reductase [Oscillospiraceae bacterium]
FAGPGEVISISHSAQSKEIFATGSINAALFLAGKPAGLYRMADLISKEE